MTIECYYWWCQHHIDYNKTPADCHCGPFCCQDKCTVTVDQLDQYRERRLRELRGYDYPSDKITHEFNQQGRNLTPAGKFWCWYIAGLAAAISLAIYFITKF